MSITRVVGTAGHIDHGKTALVRALTGIDTDRLKEEKERKISIDIGFAPLDLPGGTKVGVVDVPGHERFVKNMLAGVGGIDAVLFTIAADEGVMPQTSEHLEILHYLEIRSGLIVLTKKDLVDEEMLELVREEVEETFLGTTLEGAPILEVSSVTGEGIPEVAETLARILDEAPPRPTPDWFRLPVDRVFSSRGFGTVVTGTVWSGRVAVGDRLELLPEGREVRVRKVEVFHEDVGEAHTGQRTALALHGVSREEARRGDTLVPSGILSPTHMVDARIRLSENARDLVYRQRIRFHHGASEVLGRAVLLEGDVIPAGEEGLLQFRLESPVVLTRGDRFIIRSYSPARTLGGGTILDPNPSKHRRGREGDLDFLHVAESGDREKMIRTYLSGSRKSVFAAVDIAERLQVPVADLKESFEHLKSEGEMRAVTGGVILEETIDTLKSEIETIAGGDSGGKSGGSGVHREEIRKKLTRRVEVSLFQLLLGELLVEERITIRGETVFRGEGSLPEGARKPAAKLAALLNQHGMTPPPMEKLATGMSMNGKELASLVDLLVRHKRLVRIAPSIVYSAETIDTIRSIITSRLEKSGEMKVPDFKEDTGLSRKFAVPLLEYFDSERITRRDGDRRVPGQAFRPREE